jgi:hypothetical protein
MGADGGGNKLLDGLSESEARFMKQGRRSLADVPAPQGTQIADDFHRRILCELGVLCGDRL